MSAAEEKKPSAIENEASLAAKAVLQEIKKYQQSTQPQIANQAVLESKLIEVLNPYFTPYANDKEKSKSLFRKLSLHLHNDKIKLQQPEIFEYLKKTFGEPGLSVPFNCLQACYDPPNIAEQIINSPLDWLISVGLCLLEIYLCNKALENIKDELGNRFSQERSKFGRDLFITLQPYIRHATGNPDKMVSFHDGENMSKTDKQTAVVARLLNKLEEGQEPELLAFLSKIDLGLEKTLEPLSLEQQGELEKIWAFLNKTEEGIDLEIKKQVEEETPAAKAQLQAQLDTASAELRKIAPGLYFIISLYGGLDRYPQPLRFFVKLAVYALDVALVISFCALFLAAIVSDALLGVPITLIGYGINFLTYDEFNKNFQYYGFVGGSFAALWSSLTEIPKNGQFLWLITWPLRALFGLPLCVIASVLEVSRILIDLAATLPPSVLVMMVSLTAKVVVNLPVYAWDLLKGIVNFFFADEPQAHPEVRRGSPPPSPTHSSTLVSELGMEESKDMSKAGGMTITPSPDSSSSQNSVNKTPNAADASISSSNDNGNPYGLD